MKCWQLLLNQEKNLIKEAPNVMKCFTRKFVNILMFVYLCGSFRPSREFSLTSLSRIFTYYEDVTIIGKWLFILTFVRHSWPIWHGPTLHNCHLQVPVIPVAKRLAVELLIPVLTTSVCPSWSPASDMFKNLMSLNTYSCVYQITIYEIQTYHKGFAWIRKTHKHHVFCFYLVYRSWLFRMLSISFCVHNLIFNNV